MAINTSVLVGRLTKAPKIKQTQSGVSVCSFTLAVDCAYKSGEERQTDFIDCVAWRHHAEFLGKYFDKGDMVGITGHIQTRDWETDDGQKRKATEVVVDGISFVGGKRSEGNSEGAGGRQEDFKEVDEDGDLPF